jgi:hypothetical protein
MAIMKQHTKKKWSVIDMQVLRTMYPVCRTCDVASALGRRISCVQKMAQMNGISKTPDTLARIRAAAVPSAASVATQFKPKHGRSGNKAGPYRIWQCMKQRCNYAGHKSYGDYGGRGIKVCAAWDESFEAFLRDMGECPHGHTLGRRDNEGDYEPSNCRWETRSQQARNRRSTFMLSAFGETKCATDWCEKFGIALDTLSWRIRKIGMCPELALTTPVNKNRSLRS